MTHKDIQEINRGQLSFVDSAIIVEQPDRFHGNNHFYSDVFRPKNREYESVLDPYGESFRFNFTNYVRFGNGAATSSMSFGHSPDGMIAGITAIKLFPLGYHFQSYMTMTERLGHTEDNIIAFMGVVGSMQLLFPEKRYEEENYKIPVLPSEYRSLQI